MREKDYKQWMPVKATVHNAAKRPEFKERDVFWTSIGENVGFEQDGKSKLYTRPVVVVRKFNGSMFWGVPLSTTQKRGRYYHSTTVGQKEGVVLLSQLRVFDSSRLVRKIEMMDRQEFELLKKRLAELMSG